MSETTLRAALNLVLSCRQPNEPLRILWHAGEPLSVGLALFERASNIIRECNPRGVAVSQTIQTNGTLIDEEWCKFFVREKVLVGLSVDGPPVVHDHQRRTLGNGPTHARVMKGLALLKKYDIPLHAIAVLTPFSLDFADEIFDFFADSGFISVGFNLEETEGAHASEFRDQEVEAGCIREKYKVFMSRLFDRWQSAGRQPKIREFDQTTRAIGAFLRDHSFTRAVDDLIPLRNICVTREGEISTFSPELASGTLAEPLRFSIGNVSDVSALEELFENKTFREMNAEVIDGVRRCQSECEYFPICGGGTASNKFYERGTFDCAETTTCVLHRKCLADVVADGLRKLSISRRKGIADVVGTNDRVPT